MARYMMVGHGHIMFIIVLEECEEIFIKLSGFPDLGKVLCITFLTLQ